nr:hypothetical protein [Endozoicomonas sp.]
MADNDTKRNQKKASLIIPSRKQVAAMALQGLLANPQFSDWTEEKLAKKAVDAADELIKRLKYTRE